MKVFITNILSLAALIAVGCDTGHGPDSLFNHKPLPHAPASVCVRCHSSANSPRLDPLVTNGSGTYGKHVKHVQNRAIACERCHFTYFTEPTHMNGTFDTGNPAVNLIAMDITGPAGLWTNDTGTGTGGCSGVACHGSATLDWYGTASWTTPACTTCHVSAFSAALDPTNTNGSPPAGRHVKHVTSRNIACERCHYNYPSILTHANGVLDTPDPAVNIIRFNIVGPAALWTNDTGTQTGSCAAVACHASNTLGWYGTGTWTMPAVCTTCHSSSYASVLDPLATNGSGLAGKHGKHVTSYSMACSKCHLNYPVRTSHTNGIMDTPNPGVLLVYFDSTNPTGTWTNDTGPQSGTCSSMNCHAPPDPEWYGLAGVSLPPCSVCHVDTMGPRRVILGPGGDFGQNTGVQSHHVSGGNDPISTQCMVCHDMSQHMGGTVLVRNADSGSAIAYDPANPSTLEPFCLSCHDTTGAVSTFVSGGTPTSPFNDGSIMGTAPNRASIEIKDAWSKAYGHRQQGLTCLGDGMPNTGCHGNGHGTAYVGLLARNLTLPSTKTDWYATSDEPDYDLCFTCHASYSAVTKEAILGMSPTGNYALDLSAYGVLPAYAIGNIQTLFRDVNLGTTGKPYDDPTFFSSVHENLHMYHLQIGPAWNYRDSISSSIVCLSCHSVHGSNTQWGWVHDSLQFDHFAGSGGDQYGKIGAADLNQLDFYPTSCTFNCHSVFGPTSSWFEPSDE